MELKAKYNRFWFFSRIFLFIFIAFCLGFTDCTKEEPAASVSGRDQKAQQVTGSEAPVNYILTAEADWPRPRSDERIAQRRQMVNRIRSAYGFDDARSLNALMNVPRHWFVPQSGQYLAYADRPLDIGQGQTISQPFIVAYMTSFLELDKDKKVLEIGTGSGYQAAVLTEFTPHVYSIEIVEPLAKAAAERLKKLGYKTVKLKIGDGYKGWEEHQPFDAIIVTCAPYDIPPALIEQLAPGGRMVIPVGGVFSVQKLMVVSKDNKGGVVSKSLIPVRFVPMVHDASK